MQRIAPVRLHPVSRPARNLRRRDHFAPITTTAQSTIQIVSTRSRLVHNRHLLRIAQLPQHFQQGARIRINCTDEPSQTCFANCFDTASVNLWRPLCLARILHEQCEVEPFSVWSAKPGFQGLYWVDNPWFRCGLADFRRTSPNPRCLSTCRGSTRRGSGGVQANGHHTEQLLVRTGTAQQ